MGHEEARCHFRISKEKKEAAARQEEWELRRGRDDDSKSVHSQASTTASSREALVRREPVDASSLSLTEQEERAARKIEKKLREIAALEAQRDAGQQLEKLQLQKLEGKAELESRCVMCKVRAGYRRADLGGKAA